jgi:oxygen-independent coproporphyrinogen III oxidase
VRTVNAYYQHLDEGQLPIEKGFELSKDDLLRRQIIMTLMCSAPLDIAAINSEYGIDFDTYFAHEMSTLRQYEEAGLITIDPAAIRVTPKGRLFVRAVGMAFDKYLTQPTTSTYSKLI